MDTVTDNFSMSIKERASEESNISSTVDVGVIGEEGPLHEDEENTAPKLLFPDFTKAFNELFFSNVPKEKSPLDILKQDAFNGLLAASPLRGLAWRVFLGCIDIEKMSSWETTITEQRNVYQELVTTLYVNPREQQQHIVFDPLSNDENSPWNIFFKNQERQKTITLDIERTYQDFEFFQDQQTKDTMLRILFIYSTSTKDVSYRQGMHELLAPILYLITHEVDKFKKSQLEKQQYQEHQHQDSEQQSLINFIYDSDFIEHDTFTIFNQLMKTTVHWFGASGNNNNNSPTNTPQIKHSLHIDDTLSNNKEQIPEPMSHNQAVVKCKTINNLLRVKDVELFNHLESLDIEPQLYLLRWIRLLFGREFHLEDVLSMWDAIFAYGDNLHLIDYISISMLSFIRDQLIGKDNSAVLKRLFKYPPVEDIQYLIRKAFSIKDIAGPINNNITNFNTINHLPITPSPPAYISSSPTFTPITSVLNNNPTFNPTNPNKANYRKTMSHLPPPPSFKDDTSSTSSTSSSNPLSNSGNLISPSLSRPKPDSIFSSTTNDDLFGLGGLSIGKSNKSNNNHSTNNSGSSNSTTISSSSSSYSSSSSSSTGSPFNIIGGTTPTPSSAISTPSFTSSSSSTTVVSTTLTSSSGSITTENTPVFTTTSINLNTARINYTNPVPVVSSPKVLPKQSYVSKKANPKNPAKRLRNAQRYLGSQLGLVIPTLQTNIVDNTSLENYDALVLAVANIKQIKDMLLGDLPIPWNDVPDDEFDDEDELNQSTMIEDPLSK